MNKGTLVAFVLLIIAVAVSSSSRQADIFHSDRMKNVALILQTKQGDYGNTIKMGAEVGAKEFGVNLLFDAPEDDQDVNGQIELVYKAIRSGADAIVLAASDYKALSEAVDRANSAKIPVIAIDTEVDSSKVTSFIGTNNYEAGRQAGIQLVKSVGSQSKIAIVSFAKGSRNAEQREQGLQDVLASYPGIKIAATEISYSDPNYAGDLTRQIVSKHPDIDGIVALNSSTAIGVANAVKQLGLARKVQVIAFDNAFEELELLQEGVIHATIIQNPFSMGYLGVEHAVSAIRGDEVPGRVETGTKAIDLENMFWLDNQKLLFPFVK